MCGGGRINGSHTCCISAHMFFDLLDHSSVDHVKNQLYTADNC